jgi:hypothetical protein
MVKSQAALKLLGPNGRLESLLIAVAPRLMLQSSLENFISVFMFLPLYGEAQSANRFMFEGGCLGHGSHQCSPIIYVT